MPTLSALKTRYEYFKELFLKYERVLMPATLVFGFIVDYLTFTNINTNTAFTILLVYWIAAGGIIIFINAYDRGHITEKLRYGRLTSPFLLQFFFGALLGGSFIFYWFSGSFSVSWPFILILVILMVSNDLLRESFHKPLLQLGIYYFVTLNLFAVILPFIFNSLSPLLFVGAGIVSIGVIHGYIRILERLSTEVKKYKQFIWSIIGSILIIMNILYFMAIIPPIPLSIREAGIYHDIDREGSAYILRGERENIFQQLIPGQTIHIRPGERVYAYTAIFAPGRLNTTIQHQWEYHDEDRGWIASDRLSFPISGGRNEGYRGYTWKSTLSPGIWRVSVETRRGQVLGRMKFKVIHTQEDVQLKERVR